MMVVKWKHYRTGWECLDFLAVYSFETVTIWKTNFEDDCQKCLKTWIRLGLRLVEKEMPKNVPRPFPANVYLF